jgi:hypothetical protein
VESDCSNERPQGKEHPMSKQAAILEALTEHLKTFPSSPSIPIVESPEQDYKPVLDQEYLIAQPFLDETQTLYVGAGRKVYAGIFQVTVVYPRNSGILLAIELSDRVVDHFAKGTIIDGDGVRVKINRQPSQATPTPDGAWLRVPVSIVYQTMA